MTVLLDVALNGIWGCGVEDAMDESSESVVQVFDLFGAQLLFGIELHVRSTMWKPMLLCVFCAMCVLLPNCAAMQTNMIKHRIWIKRLNARFNGFCVSSPLLIVMD